MSIGDFGDLLAANQRYARSSPKGFDGVAHAGILMITCMDSRLEPLEMIGLRIGEAKIIRTPGGIVTDYALSGTIIGALLLNVNRILVVPHTKCAMSASRDELIAKVQTRVGVDISALPVDCPTSQSERLAQDVETLRSHPLLPAGVLVGGFIYDVDTGLLHQEC